MLQYRRKKKIHETKNCHIESNDVKLSPSAPGVRIPDLENIDSDIYVEMTQEDSRDPSDISMIIEPQYIQSFDSVHPIISSLNTKKTAQNIITKILVKNSLSVYRKETGSIHILSAKSTEATNLKGVFKNMAVSIAQSTLASATKGATYVKLFINNNKNPLLFVNMHLPIYTNDKKTLGYTYRKKSMIEILHQLIVKKIYDQNTVLIIGGDLNFRFYPNPTNPEQALDQLTELLKNSNELPIRLQEFQMNESEKAFTCKLQTSEEYMLSNLEECREQRISNNMNDIQTFQRNCGDANRIPSRCDRFLFRKPENVSMNILVNKIHYIREIDSDHNAIYSVFELDLLGNSVGGKTKRKSQKKKSRKQKSQKNKKTQRRIT